MNDIERMLAVEAIKQTKARYFRFLDTKDLENFCSVFAADATMDMRGETADGSGLVKGNRQIAEFILNSVAGVITVHHGHTPEIELVLPISAHGIWAMEDKLWKIANSPSVLPFNTMHGYGHYHETYSMADGHWFIQTMTLKRLRVDIKS
jgi:hypothetical protein